MNNKIGKIFLLLGATFGVYSFGNVLTNEQIAVATSLAVFWVGSGSFILPELDNYKSLS